MKLPLPKELSLDLSVPPWILCKSTNVNPSRSQAFYRRRNERRRCLSSRLSSQPERFPYGFRLFCESCGSGSGMIWCSNCDGEGYFMTEPGKAGHPYKSGTARCKSCNGIGVLPCPLCGGSEVSLRRPDPDNGPRGDKMEEEGSLLEWLAQF